MSETYRTIDAFFTSVKSKMPEYEPIIALSNLSFEKRTKREGVLSGVIQFFDKSILHVLEYVYIERENVKHSSYRFHWQTFDGFELSDTLQAANSKAA